MANSGELLTKEQQDQIHELTEGNLTDCIAWAIQGAAALSPSVSESLKSNGTIGFMALVSGSKQLQGDGK